MEDFLTLLGHEGLAGRLKRLSDELLYSTRDYYKSVGLDIGPNWHLVFLLFEKKEELTITDISEALNMSHPAIVKIVNTMKEKGYLQNKKDENDARKQNLTLTEKAKSKLPEFKKHWEAGILTMQQLVSDSPNFLEELSHIEAKFKERNYKERTLENFKAG